MTAARDTLPGWLEQAWLERYLERGLSPEEVEWFEVYVLDKPHLIAQMEADSALRDALHAAALDASRSISTKAPSRADTHGVAFHARPRRRRFLNAIALAASIVVALGVGWMLPRDAVPGAAFVAAPERVVYDTLRGESAEPWIQPQPGDTSGVYIADIAVPVGVRRVSLQIEVDGRTISLADAQVSSEGFLTLVLPKVWRTKSRLIIVPVGGPDMDRKNNARPHTSIIVEL